MHGAVKMCECSSEEVFKDQDSDIWSKHIPPRVVSIKSIALHVGIEATCRNQAFTVTNDTSMIKLPIEEFHGHGRHAR